MCTFELLGRFTLEIRDKIQPCSPQSQVQLMSRNTRLLCSGEEKGGPFFQADPSKILMRYGTIHAWAHMKRAQTRKHTVFDWPTHLNQSMAVHTVDAEVGKSATCLLFPSFGGVNFTGHRCALHRCRGSSEFKPVSRPVSSSSGVQVVF